MNVFKLLKPAPLLQELQGEDLIRQNYRYWRMRTFYAMYAGYAFFYFSRKSFTFAMPAMQNELGLDKFQLGLLASIFSITYGVSKFASGILGDKSNPRYFMSIGLLLTGVFNVLFGMSSTWIFFAVFWSLNAWFQGWGWPGCAKLLTHWYSQSERGRWWSVWNTSHNLGGAIIPLIVAACMEWGSWRFGLFFPGALCMLASFFLMNRLRDTPQSLGLPPIERFRGEVQEKKETSDLSAKEILWDHVIKNKFIWMLSFASFFVYVIRTAINDWSMMYLSEAKGYSSVTSGMCVCCFELGGFAGSLAAGWGSDLFFKGKRMPVNIIFTTAVLFVLITFRCTVFYAPVLDGVLLFLLGFFIFGPQMLIGLACAELSHKKAAATSTGFSGCFSYLGAACAGGPLGAVMTVWGWDSFFICMILCSFCAVFFMLPLWSVQARRQFA